MASGEELRKNILQATGEIDEEEAESIADKAADALAGFGKKAKKGAIKGKRAAKTAQRNRQMFQADLERRRKEFEEQEGPKSLEDVL